jgi:hypothetical protein
MVYFTPKFACKIRAMPVQIQYHQNLKPGALHDEQLTEICCAQSGGGAA